MVCLALGGVPAAAQEVSDTASQAPAAVSKPALVTGTESCQGGDGTQKGSPTYVLYHDPSFECTVEASDPRVSGPGRGEFFGACYQLSGCIYWGTYELTGPDGTWAGEWSGTDDAGLNVASYLITLEGSGDYEGWTFVAHWQDRSGESTFSGLIYPGPPPPWEPPAE